MKRLNENQLRHLYLQEKEIEKQSALFVSIVFSIIGILQYIIIAFVTKFNWLFILSLSIFIFLWIISVYSISSYFKIKEEIEVNDFK